MGDFNVWTGERRAVWIDHSPEMETAIRQAVTEEYGVGGAVRVEDGIINVYLHPSVEYDFQAFGTRLGNIVHD